MIQEGTAFAVLLCGPAPSPLQLQLVRADGSDVHLAEMEWHGGAKIFDGVMTKKGKEGKEMKGDTGSDGSGAAVPHCYDLAIG